MPVLRHRSHGDSSVNAKTTIGLVVGGVVLAVTLIFSSVAGLYTVQPIGALPDGVTLVVHREPGEPFFNSPDGMCLKRVGYVSLMCRMTAFGQAPTDRIITRLPYMKWAYLRSTGGRDFDQ